MFLTNTFASVENTRTVAKNLGCGNQYDGNLNANRVDVLIPEVYQVSLVYKIIWLKYLYIKVMGEVRHHRILSSENGDMMQFILHTYLFMRE